MPKNLFQQFGATFELGYYYRIYERSLQAVVAEFLVPGKKQGFVHESNWVAIWYWCDGDRSEATQYAAECVEHAVEYFFGNWRKTIPTDKKTVDAEWWKVHAGWLSVFSEALCWASTLGDWNSVRRLAEYPTKDIKAGVHGTREEGAAYFALACFLRAEPQAVYEHCFQIIQRGGGQKPKLLADIIRSLQAKDGSAFQKGLDAYLRYFVKREFDKANISKLLSLDGTTLVNIGRREGLKFRVLPEAEDHLIEFPEGTS